MNAILEKSILERLHQLDDAHLYRVLEFVTAITTTPTSPQMMGLFSHLNIHEDDLEQQLQEVKQHREQSLNSTMDSLF